jgi:hypothetical protein
MIFKNKFGGAKAPPYIHIIIKNNNNMNNQTIITSKDKIKLTIITVFTFILIVFITLLSTHNI